MTTTKAPSVDYAALSELPAWEVAGRFGCRYAGDWSPHKHGVMFYRARDWERFRRAEIIQVYPGFPDRWRVAVMLLILESDPNSPPCDDIDQLIIETSKTKAMNLRGYRKFTADIEPADFYKAISDWLAVLGRED